MTPLLEINEEVEVKLNVLPRLIRSLTACVESESRAEIIDFVVRVRTPQGIIEQRTRLLPDEEAEVEDGKSKQGLGDAVRVILQFLRDHPGETFSISRVAQRLDSRGIAVPDPETFRLAFRAASVVDPAIKQVNRKSWGYQPAE